MHNNFKKTYFFLKFVAFKAVKFKCIVINNYSSEQVANQSSFMVTRFRKRKNKQLVFEAFRGDIVKD